LADNLKIAIRLVADGSDFRAEIDQATRGLDRLGASAGVVDAAMAGHGRTLARTGGEMDALSTRSRAVQEAQSGAARAMDQLARAAVALGAGLTVGTLIEYADGWKSVESRLKLVTNGAAELRAAQEQLFDVAQRTRQSFDATAETFARFARSTQGMGASNGDILRVVETINQAVAISGGPAASAEAALFQLGQAMASGALRGDELNSVLEQTPRLAEAIATGMGRSTGELRSMAEQGKLTSDAVLRSLLNQGAAVNREFGQITPTVASSMTMLRNAVQKYVGETDQAWGATRALAGGVTSLASNLDAVAGMADKAALGVAAIGAARLIPTGVQALTNLIDYLKSALYAKAVATVEAANAEKIAAAQSLITAQRTQATTAATLAGAEAEFASRAAAASSAAAGVTAAEATLTQARAKTSLTTNVYVASKALAAERDAQAAATAAREASIAADAEKAASLARLRVAQAEAAAAGGAVAAANTHLTIAAEGAAAASGALAQRAGLLSTAWAVTRWAGAGLLSLVGGPLGAGFLAVAAATAYFATRQSAAEKAARDHADALRLIGSSAEALEQKLTKVGAALTNVDKLQIRQKLAQAEENMAATRGSLGTANSTTGLLGRWASIGVQASNEIEAIGQKFAGATFNADAYAEELAKIAERHADDKAITSYIVGMLRAVDGYKAAETDAKKYRDALNGVASATESASLFPTRFTNKLGELGAKLSEITEKARALQALPGLSRRLEELVGSAPVVAETVNGYSDRHGTAQDKATQRYEANKEVAKLYLGRLTDAEAKEQIRLVGEQVKAERDYQKAVAGTNVVEIAKAEAKKKVADLVANGFPAAQKDKLLEQETALALERVSGAAGAAATDLGAATTATMRLAQAAGAGEAAQRAATYANKEAEASLKGNIALSAVRAANAQDEAAAILTIRNETVRGLALETANTNALTTAMAAGGEAVRAAQENEYKLGLIRKLGTDATVAGTAAQRALNDAMDAYRANRAANDNSALEKERQAANDNLALAQRELALMGEAEGVRSRALETLRNQQEAARKVVELGEEGARQWLAWQEQIADTRALVDFQKEVKQTSKSIADDLAAKMFDKGGSILDWWRNLLKRMAIEIASTQFIMPIVQQVVGAVPQLFGIQAPANASGGQTAAGGGLTGTLTNTALSKGLGWAVDKAVPGGLMGGLDAWGYSTLGVGTASYGAPLVGANGMLTGGGATSLATPTGITGGLSGYFGAASAGAFGGVLGGLIGTAANSKAIGGLSGAALGAGSAALASYLGLGALGGPVGLAVAAIAGGVMGLLGTAKKSVGPNGASNIRLDSGAVQAGDSATDNGASSEKAQQIAAAAAASFGGLLTAAGGKLNAGYSGQDARIDWYEQSNKFISVVGGVNKEFGTLEAAMTDTTKRLVDYYQGKGLLTLDDANAQTALRNSKATSPDELLKDVAAARAWTDVQSATASGYNPFDAQIKAMLEAAQTTGEQFKAQFLDLKQRILDLGVASEQEALPKLRSVFEAQIGLGDALTPLRGVALVAKQAEINIAAFRPTLEALGYTAAEQADVVARYTAKMVDDYDRQIAAITRVGDIAVAQALDGNYRIGAADVLRGVGVDPTAAGLNGVVAAIGSVWDAFGVGVADAGRLTAAQSALNGALRVGLISGDQYKGLIETLTQSYQTAAAASADLTARSRDVGSGGVWSRVDAIRRQGAADSLIDPVKALTVAGAALDAVFADLDPARVAALRGEFAGMPAVLAALDRAVERTAAAAGDAAAQLRADAAAQAADILIAAPARARDAYVATLDREASALRDAAGRARDLGKALTALPASLALDRDLSPDAPVNRLAAARAQLTDAAQRARVGDAEALALVQSLIPEFLRASRDYNSSAPAYAADYTWATGLASEIGGLAAASADGKDAAARAIDRQIGALGGTVSALDRTATSLDALRQATLDAAARYQQAQKGQDFGDASVANDNRVVAAATSQTGNAYTGDFTGGQFSKWAVAQTAGREQDWGSWDTSADHVVARMLTAVTGYSGAFSNGKFVEWVKSSAATELQREASRSILRRNGFVPAFVDGGDHVGGVRLVGENGPELELTGPSRIHSAEQTRQLLRPPPSTDLGPVIVALGGTAATIVNAITLSGDRVTLEIGKLQSAVARLSDVVADQGRELRDLATQIRKRG
jgi:trimeric autotransporter adhesin